MFFKFDGISGRLAPSSQSGAYAPQGLRPLVEEPVQFQFSSKTTKPVATVESFSVTSSSPTGNAKGIVPSSAGYQHVRRLQSMWAVDDGLMVWQKIGMRDRGPYWLTGLICGVAIAASFSVLWNMSWPKKQD